MPSRPRDQPTTNRGLHSTTRRPTRLLTSTRTMTSGEPRLGEPTLHCRATFNLARARRGITTTDIERITMPAIVPSGRSRNHSVLALSTATYAASARKQAPTNRWVRLSDCERRATSRSDRRRHWAAPLALTSMRLSMPKPISATLPGKQPRDQ